MAFPRRCALLRLCRPHRSAGRRLVDVAKVAAAIDDATRRDPSVSRPWAGNNDLTGESIKSFFADRLILKRLAGEFQVGVDGWAGDGVVVLAVCAGSENGAITVASGKTFRTSFSIVWGKSNLMLGPASMVK